MDDPPPLSELAEALYRHDDIAVLIGVLVTTLAELVPPDLLTVDRRRSAADRMRGRPGTPVRLTFASGDRAFTLAADGTATEAHAVRGVVLSRGSITTREWITRLTERLTALAAEDERARAALERFLLD